MRITEGTIAGNYLYAVGRSRERIVQLQTQLASGKKILKSSDDPQVAGSVMRLSESLKQRQQFYNNAIEGQGVADTTAMTLGQFSDVLISVKDLMVRASSTAYVADMNTFGERADQYLSELVDIANTTFSGKYIFGGTHTTDQPFTLNSDRTAVIANPDGIDGDIRYPLGEGIAQQANISGEEGLMGTAIFELVIQIRDSLKTGDFKATDFLPQFEDAMEHVLNKSSYAASFAEHFQAVADNLNEQELQLKQYMSVIQDTDVAEATMKLKHEEVMLDAALNTGGRIIPKSLLDFLR
ncbi:MAG: hypothetical protein HUU02_05165 [Bacteroidetes bacterium]|nr:hypothetical protein [Bacteroidota bacterium]